MTQRALDKLTCVQRPVAAGIDQTQAQAHVERLGRALEAEIAASIANLRAPKLACRHHSESSCADDRGPRHDMGRNYGSLHP